MIIVIFKFLEENIKLYRMDVWYIKLMFLRPTNELCSIIATYVIVFVYVING